MKGGRSIFIRHRTRQLIKAGFCGAVSVGIPLSILIFVGSNNLKGMTEKLTVYEMAEQEQIRTKVCVLKTDVFAGDIISADMLSESIIASDREDFIEVCGKEEMIGASMKINMSAGTVLTRDMVYKGEDMEADKRIVELSNIYMPVQLNENDLVDVRISFPDGEDYIVVSKKRIYDLLYEGEERTGFTMRLDEKAMLRISSASVDMNDHEGTMLYAVKYIGDHQTNSTEFYPVNEAVFSLTKWDPNVTDSFTVPEEALKRAILEENLREYYSKLEEGGDEESSEDEKSGDTAVSSDRTERMFEALEIYEE